MVKRAIGVVCAAVAVFAVTGCTSSVQKNGASGITPVSSAPTGAPTTPAPATATPTSAPATTPAPAVTVTVTATTKPVSVAPCKVGSLSIAVNQNSGAAGTIVQMFTVANKSSVTCTMNKYPGIDPFGLLSQGGSKVQANLDWKVGPIPSDMQPFGAAGGLRTLAPGGSAIFFLKWGQIPVGNATCSDATGFEFQAPQYTGTAGNYLEVDVKYTVCGEQLYVSQMMDPSIGTSF